MKDTNKINEIDQIDSDLFAMGEMSLDQEPLVPIKIILLDDDPTFAKVLSRYTKYKNIELTCCQNVSEFADHLSENSYDIAIVDYFLDSCTGSDVADCVKETPILLVSRKSNWIQATPDLPESIVDFVHKKYGADVILNLAAKLAKQTASI